MQPSPLEQPRLGPETARALVARAERVSGIVVDADKTDFIRLRVGRRLRALGLADFEAYLGRLDGPEGEAELRHLVECLTTHTTSFFREGLQYDWLQREGFDRLLQSQPASGFLVWSAAASLGVELWSAGMLLAERNDARQGPRAWELVGTDISRRILARAEAATYAEDEIAGLSPERRQRFLLRSRQSLGRDGKPVYRIVPELRRRARFEPANLQELDGLRGFTADLVFLRNVLIYFDERARRRVVDAVIARLRPGGVLLTGHAEALPAHPRLETLRPTIYRKV